MAGVKLDITPVGMPEIQSAINELLALTSDLTPAMRQIGEILMVGHELRFEKQISPSGLPWAEHSAVTKQMKGKNADKKLIWNHHLKGTLNYRAYSDALEFGTPLEYGAMHHFGGKTSPHSMIPNAIIPARPWLGVHDDDRKEIYAMLGKYLSQAKSA